MKRIVLAVCCVLSIPAIAAPLRTEQISSTAKWVLHLDVEAFKLSSLGSMVVNEIRAEHQQQLDALAELVGSNILQDIHQITLYGSDGDEKKAVLMVTGRFNPDKLLALLALNGTDKTILYGNYTLHEWVSEDNGKNQVGVFARNDLIVLSQTTQAVEQALDVLDGKTPSLSQSENLACLHNAPADPIFLLAAEDLGQLTGDNEHAAILKNSEVLIFAADEVNQNVSLALDLWAQDVQTAAQIEQVVLGIKAFLILSQAKDPELAQLLQSFQFSRQDTKISIRLQYPSEELFSILKHDKDLQEGIQKGLGSEPEQTEDNS